MSERRIAVVGGGYVGSVVAACFALVGHEVVLAEQDPARAAQLREGRSPFHEPRIDTLLAEGIAAGRLTFSPDAGSAMAGSEFVLVCVGTPPGSDGMPDLRALRAAAATIGKSLETGQIIVTKSTVPVGTGRWLSATLQDEGLSRAARAGEFAIVSNPEFLREGTAVRDFLAPDRIVVGSDDAGALEEVVRLYQPIVEQEYAGAPAGSLPIPVVRTDLPTAEMTKYASNAFLATKVSFANEMAHLCGLLDADAAAVLRAVGLDSRIAPGFLAPGIGWGGSCLGKDLRALTGAAEAGGYVPRLLAATVAVNEEQRRWVVDQLAQALGELTGARIALLGLAFKADTDDSRDSPGLDVARRLLVAGADVVAFDPLVHEVGEPAPRMARSVEEAVRGADAVVVTTDASTFARLDPANLRSMMRGDVLVDGRSVVDVALARAAGLRYFGIGRDAPGLPKAQNAAFRTYERW